MCMTSAYSEYFSMLGENEVPTIHSRHLNKKIVERVKADWLKIKLASLTSDKISRR